MINWTVWTSVVQLRVWLNTDSSILDKKPPLVLLSILISLSYYYYDHARCQDNNSIYSQQPMFIYVKHCTPRTIYIEDDRKWWRWVRVEAYCIFWGLHEFSLPWRRTRRHLRHPLRQSESRYRRHVVALDGIRMSTLLSEFQHPIQARRSDITAVFWTRSHILYKTLPSRYIWRNGAFKIV